MTTKVLRFGQLAERGIDFSRKHIRALEAEGKFPVRIALGANSVAWREREIDEWLESRPRVVVMDAGQ
jgi:predicted DNA-binding transcriptional regulator AlpA